MKLGMNNCQFLTIDNINMAIRTLCYDVKDLRQIYSFRLGNLIFFRMYKNILMACN